MLGAMNTNWHNGQGVSREQWENKMINTSIAVHSDREKSLYTQ